MLSHPQSSLLDRIKEGLAYDPTIKNKMEYAKEGKTRRFWLEGDLLYMKGKRLYVSLFGNLRRELLKECYDSLWSGHPRVHRTLALTEENYYWSRLRDDFEAYVKTCLMCQQDKTEERVLAELLEPLPIPEQPWESISMNLIMGLPKFEGFNIIIVVVDRFSKYGFFIPAPAKCPAEIEASLFLRHVVKYWGLSKTIVSDRDGRFTGGFWTELFKLMGSDLNFSTSFHPQIDGQTERVNGLLDRTVREANNHPRLEYFMKWKGLPDSKSS